METRHNPFGADREPLLAHAREALAKYAPGGVPTKTSGQCMALNGEHFGGAVKCIETHHFGVGGTNNWTGDDLLEGGSYSLFGTWNLCEKRYEAMWAYYSRVLRNDVSVDLSEVLGDRE